MKPLHHRLLDLYLLIPASPDPTGREDVTSNLDTVLQFVGISRKTPLAQKPLELELEARKRQS